jgi:hypothetical protein
LTPQTCPGRCEELKACVQCQVFKNGEFKDNEEACNNCSFVAIEVDNLESERELKLVFTGHLMEHQYKNNFERFRV